MSKGNTAGKYCRHEPLLFELSLYKRIEACAKNYSCGALKYFDYLDWDMSGIIQTLTLKISQSIAFYTSLVFTIIKEGDFHYVFDVRATSWTNEKRASGPGRILNNMEWSKGLSILSDITKVYERKARQGTSAPGPLWIYLESNQLTLLTEKKEEIRVFNSDTKVDNIKLQDPAGLDFFVFSD